MFENLWALIIEDDAHTLLVAASILSELDIRFKRNTTGHEAAQQARTMHPRPDFVLLDLSLPEDDPYRILHSFKTDAALAQIPVIAIDHDLMCHDLGQLQDMGFDGFIGKPLPRRDFPLLLRRVLLGESLWESVSS